MRIVVNASAVSAIKGGASFYIINIVKALASQNSHHEFIVVCTKSSASYFSSICGIATSTILAPASVLLRLIWEQFLLPFICRKYNADILFSPNYSMPLLSLGYRNVVSIFDLSFFPLSNLYPRSRRLFKSIIRISSYRADRIIAISEHTKNDISRYIGSPVEKTTVIYCAADERFSTREMVAEAPSRHSFNLVNPYILFTGFLEPRKNLTRLINAYAKICNRIPHDLVIAGGNGWWYKTLPDTIKSLGINERVRFLGYVPDESLPALYRGADLFAFVSLYEGFGIAALESLWCGTPVLASNNSSLPEVVGDAGVYVDPYNVDDIAEKLLCINDKALMQALRDRCAAQSQKFSWNKAAKETLLLFQTTLNNKHH